MSTFQIKKILVPVDFSETSLRAMEHAIYLARLKKAELVLIHVIEDAELHEKITAPIYSREEYIDTINRLKPALIRENAMIETETRAKFDNLVENAQKKGAIKTSYVLESGKVGKQICEYADKKQVSLIVMGTHGISGFREFMVGSNTYHVVKNATCPVLSIQNGSVPGFKNILLPFTDKPHLRESVDYAREIAKVYNSKIHILGIDTENTKEHLFRIQKEGEQIKKIIETSNVRCSLELISSSFVAEVLLEQAEKKNADLVAIVSDLDRMSFSQYFAGPVVKQLVNHSATPILSVPPTFNYARNIETWSLYPNG